MWLNGLSPLRFPMQMMKYCCNLVEDLFPNVLGCSIVKRLPPVVRVIAQAFIQSCKTGRLAQTKNRRRDISKASMQHIPDGQTSTTESVADIVNAEDLHSVQSSYQYDMIMDIN
ncbi:hypothetical protein Pfo_025244 [Paulownia fortunei]|nr:hypothetical protein Pfo_025244 [Paulownia fortunei]